MVLMGYTFLLGIVFLLGVKSDDDNPVLTIEDGQIRGITGNTVGKNNAYYAFRGIPFAKPPIGNLRFRPAERNLKWNDTLDATQDRSQCVQNANPVEGSEDCLYINVYTRTLTTANLSVMVWIYGGGFYSGNSSYALYGPDYLLDEDVVFVSFNYRLGVFGFVSTEDTICPGNFGLGDQILALQWVQRNIEYFGGDPKKVTIFGQSAGAASASYLLQIASAKGLYRAAIMESGSSLCPWALNRRARRTAFGTGIALGILTSNSSQLIDGLRKVDYQRLQSAAMTVSTINTLENPLASLMFSPVKEPSHEGALFYDDSDELLSGGDFHRVPTLIGFTSNEAVSVQGIPALLFLFMSRYDVQPTQLVPVDLTENRQNISAAASVIKSYYFGDLPVAVQPEATLKYINDDAFNRPIRRQFMDTSQYSPVYFYQFSYEGVLGRSSASWTSETLMGVGHAEELGYLFAHNTDTERPISEYDRLTRLRMVKLWTNFAKYLNPTPTEDDLLQNITWPLANETPNNLTYLNINTSLEIQLDPFRERMEFWDGIYDKYGDPPYDTY